VLVHSQVCEVSPTLVRRVIRELMSLLLQDLLNCYRKVDGFSMGGMLQATLETEFIHQSLRGFETPAISAAFKLIYDSLEHSRIKKEGDSTQEMEELLKKVKMIISNARKATGAQFLCFREDASSNDEEI
jgi:exocyst complex component 2